VEVKAEVTCLVGGNNFDETLMKWIQGELGQEQMDHAEVHKLRHQCEKMRAEFEVVLDISINEKVVEVKKEEYRKI
jgi:molecular chaperone DnaK (HSP70)